MIIQVLIPSLEFHIDSARVFVVPSRMSASLLIMGPG